MHGKNSFEVLGNLTRTPELRQTASGKTYCFLTVAVNRSVKNGDKWEQAADFIDMIAWEKRAEFLANHLIQGDKLYLEGRITSYSKEIEDGKHHTAMRLTVRDLMPLSWKKRSGIPVQEMEIPARDIEDFSSDEEYAEEAVEAADETGVPF